MGSRLGVRKTFSGQPPDPCCGLDIVHVDAVHVGTLFAVNLDGHEALIEDLCNIGVLERFALHNMTPMAGSVSYTDEQQAIGFGGQGNGIGAPHLPCHGVLHVAADIRTTALIESIFQLGGRRPERQRPMPLRGGVDPS